MMAGRSVGSALATRRQQAQLLSAFGVAFGAAALLAPEKLAAVYKVPPDPYGKQLARLFGTRTVALAVWGLTAKTEEELDRGLAITAVATAVDAVTAALSAKDVGPSAAARSAVSSAIFSVAALCIRASTK
jgi:hypothetical protein